MTAPLLSKLCVALALLIAIWRAFLGPPPKRGSRTTVHILVAAAVLWYLGAILAYGDDRDLVLVGVLVAIGILTTCVAGWLARYRPPPPAAPREEEEPGPPGEEPYVPLWAGYRDPTQGGSRLWSDK